MSEHVYRVLEFAGSSETSIDDAIRHAVNRASKSVTNMRWFEVTQIRGEMQNEKIAYWQVQLKVGYRDQEEQPQKAGAKKMAGDSSPVKDTAFAKYRCTVCGYIYDPQKGDPDNGIEPGTPFEKLPDDWVCPECGVGKERFEKVV